MATLFVSKRFCEVRHAWRRSEKCCHTEVTSPLLHSFSSFLYSCESLMVVDLYHFTS